MTSPKSCRRLNEEEKNDVKGWLLKPTLNGKCPFMNYDHKLCKSWFPKITEKCCPCHQYSFAHIVASAMRMIQ